MKVKLLQDIEEGGRLKTVKRRNRKWTGPSIEDPGKPGARIPNPEPEHIWVTYTKGTVIEMSALSAKKYIDKGWAEAVEEPPKPEPKTKGKKRWR